MTAFECRPWRNEMVLSRQGRGLKTKPKTGKAATGVAATAIKPDLVDCVSRRVLGKSQYISQIHWLQWRSRHGTLLKRADCCHVVHSATESRPTDGQRAICGAEFSIKVDDIDLAFGHIAVHFAIQLLTSDRTAGTTATTTAEATSPTTSATHPNTTAHWSVTRVSQTSSTPCSSSGCTSDRSTPELRPTATIYSSRGTTTTTGTSTSTRKSSTSGSICSTSPTLRSRPSALSSRSPTLRTSSPAWSGSTTRYAP